jgi:hypothetical protein
MEKALGGAEETKQKVTHSVRQNALEIRLVRTTGCETAGRKGPGASDVIVYLEGVRMVWIDDGQRTKLALLGAEGIGCKRVSVLREALARLRGPAAPRAICLDRPAAANAQAGAAAQQRCNAMSARTIQGLLDQDPFVAGGAQAHLAADRFERQQAIISDPGVTVTNSFAVHVEKDDLNASSRSTVTTDDYSKSWLSFAGIGPTETKRVVSTMTATSSTSFRNGQTVATSVRIEGPPPGTDRIDVYYDRVFGTLAFRASHLP